MVRERGKRKEGKGGGGDGRSVGLLVEGVEREKGREGWCKSRARKMEGRMEMRVSILFHLFSSPSVME